MQDQTIATIERDRKYAWDYFQLHSSQRIATFNFYLTLSLALITGIATVLQSSIELPEIALILSFVLILISFVFYKLDQRNKMLIKRAEAALKEIEDRLEPENSSQIPFVSLFRRDEKDVTQRRSQKTILFWLKYYSYSNCFNLIFGTFSTLGLLGGLLAAKMFLF